jgi:hypothetical protein
MIAWGRNNSNQTNVLANLTNVIAIAAGGDQSLALLSNGTVTNWRASFGAIPVSATNVAAIVAGTNFCMALRSNGTVIAWGNNTLGQTNVPSALSNVVAIAAGGAQAFALRSDGTVTNWGATPGSIPANLTNVMGIAAGYAHAVALRNDATVAAWGNNSSGQTNVPTWLGPAKLIAAGGNQSLASIFSPLLQYPVDVSKDLLLIYNTNSSDSLWVKDYYLANRPLAVGANVAGVGYTNSTSPGYYETITPTDLTNLILSPVSSWLAANPTKRPQYVILFLDVPNRVFTNAAFPTNGFYPRNDFARFPSVSVQLQSIAPNWRPFATHINLEGTNGCKAYIDKLAAFGTNGQMIIGASVGRYDNTNYVLDGIRHGGPFPCFEDYSGAGNVVSTVTNALLAAGVSSTSIAFSDGIEICTAFSTNCQCTALQTLPHATGITNVAGYICWGAHSSLGPAYAINGAVKWNGNSQWYIIETLESFNGLRVDPGQGTFVKWFSPAAFGGTNYSRTPIGAVTHVDEPGGAFNDPSVYFGLWARGKTFAICAWHSRKTPYFQAVGDPFVRW